MSFEFDKSTRHALRTLHADVPTSHYSSLTVHSPKTCPYVLLYNKSRHSRVDGHAELVSASVRGEVLILARSEILKQVQDDIRSHLLFILSFWGRQFNTSVQK